MAKPDVWWVLPSLAITPAKTFFGLDKNAAHCFTIDKRMYSGFETKSISNAFGISMQNKQVPVIFVIGGREYDAELRLANLNRTKTRTLSPDDQMERMLYQFQWAKFERTVAAIRDVFWAAYECVRDNRKTDVRVVFHHLGNNVFLIRSILIGEEFKATLRPKK